MRFRISNTFLPGFGKCKTNLTGLSFFQEKADDSFFVPYRFQSLRGTLFNFFYCSSGNQLFLVKYFCGVHEYNRSPVIILPV